MVAEWLVAIDFEKESTNSLMQDWVLLQYGVTSMCSMPNAWTVCEWAEIAVRRGEGMEKLENDQLKNWSILCPGYRWPSHAKAIAIKAEVKMR